MTSGSDHGIPESAPSPQLPAPPPITHTLRFTAPSGSTPTAASASESPPPGASPDPAPSPPSPCKATTSSSPIPKSPVHAAREVNATATRPARVPHTAASLLHPPLRSEGSQRRTDLVALRETDVLPRDP